MLDTAVKNLELVYDEIDVFSSDLEEDLNKEEKEEIESQIEAIESMMNDIEGFLQEIRNILD